MSKPNKMISPDSDALELVSEAAPGKPAASQEPKKKQAGHVYIPKVNMNMPSGKHLEEGVEIELTDEEVEAFLKVGHDIKKMFVEKK